MSHVAIAVGGDAPCFHIRTKVPRRVLALVLETLDLGDVAMTKQGVDHDKRGSLGIVWTRYDDDVPSDNAASRWHPLPHRRPACWHLAMS